MGDAIALAVFGTIILLAVSSILGEFCFHTDASSDQRQVDASILNTLTQVTGAVFGTLLAVVTFSVGLRAQREDEASALLPFVAQRYGMFLIAGTAVAVTAADGIMPILQPWISNGALRVLLLLNILLVPLTLVGSLWLVCKVIQDAGVSTLENTLPVFRAKMHLIAIRDARHRLLFEGYSFALSSRAIGYNGVAWHVSPWSGELRDTFEVGGRGYVADVDLRALRALCDAVASLGPTVSAELTVRPGDRLDKHALMVLRERPPEETTETGIDDELGAPRAHESVLNAGLSDEVRRSIRNALDRLFISRRRA